MFTSSSGSPAKSENPARVSAPAVRRGSGGGQEGVGTIITRTSAHMGDTWFHLASLSARKDPSGASSLGRRPRGESRKEGRAKPRKGDT
eukprot:210491-Pyramimonas_sp.AAC.1